VSEVLLQKKVGKAVIVHPRTGRVLILQLNEEERRARSTPGKEFNEWHIPGGSEEPVDEGSAEKAAVREALEETGLVLRVLGVLGVANWDALYEGEQAHFEATFFACVVGEGELEPPVVATGEESTASAWITEAEMPNYVPQGLTPQAQQFIPLAIQMVQEEV
jgi:ADP-ribose pyrophosphatase YjhB (NUDIX family)